MNKLNLETIFEYFERYKNQGHRENNVVPFFYAWISEKHNNGFFADVNDIHRKHSFEELIVEFFEDFKLINKNILEQKGSIGIDNLRNLAEVNSELNVRYFEKIAPLFSGKTVLNEKLISNNIINETHDKISTNFDDYKKLFEAYFNKFEKEYVYAPKEYILFYAWCAAGEYGHTKKYPLPDNFDALNIHIDKMLSARGFEEKEVRIHQENLYKNFLEKVSEQNSVFGGFLSELGLTKTVKNSRNGETPFKQLNTLSSGFCNHFKNVNYGENNTYVCPHVAKYKN